MAGVGVRSYHTFMLGLAFALFLIVIVVTARTPRPIGYLMGLSGLAYLVQGWVIGSEGFSATNTAPTLLGILLVLTWSIWLLVSAWRMREAVEAPIRISHPPSNSRCVLPEVSSTHRLIVACHQALRNAARNAS